MEAFFHWLWEILKICAVHKRHLETFSMLKPQNVNSLIRFWFSSEFTLDILHNAHTHTILHGIVSCINRMITSAVQQDTARLGAKRDFEVWIYDSDNSMLTKVTKLGLAFMLVDLQWSNFNSERMELPIWLRWFCCVGTIEKLLFWKIAILWICLH